MKKLRVIIYRDGLSWVAQCVERDLKADALSLKVLYERFERAYERAIEYAGMSDLPETEAWAEVLWDKRVSQAGPVDAHFDFTARFEFAIA